MLDLVFAGHQQSENLEICRRLRPAHLRNGLLPMHGEIPQQRANYRLAQAVTRATQSSGWVFSKWKAPYREVKRAVTNCCELGTTRHCCAPRGLIARSFEMRWCERFGLG